MWPISVFWVCSFLVIFWRVKASFNKIFSLPLERIDQIWDYFRLELSSVLKSCWLVELLVLWRLISVNQRRVYASPCYIYCPTVCFMELSTIRIFWISKWENISYFLVLLELILTLSLPKIFVAYNFIKELLWINQ